MKTVLLAGVAAAALASASMADVTFTMTNTTWTGFNFTEAYAAGSLTGTLTGASVNVTLNASTNYTYADDLTIYVAGSPLAYGGMLQCGGFSNLQTAPANRYGWGTGASSAPGTTMNTTVNFINGGVNMSANPTMSVWIGNGYGAAGTSGTWTGTITLIGVNAVPAPGAIALLGLAGLVGRRRR
jgi:hypothetical protein